MPTKTPTRARRATNAKGASAKKRTTTKKPAPEPTETSAPTSYRFTSEDRAIIAELCQRTGLRQSVQVIRLALREALSSRTPRK